MSHTPRAQLVSPQPRPGGHAAHDLDCLQADPLEVVVVESAVGEDLLEEGDEHARAVLVRARQVQVL